MTRSWPIGSLILAFALLAPGLIVTSFFVLFLLVILTGALATAHPGGAVVLPVGLGVAFSSWGHDVEPSLGGSRRTIHVCAGLFSLITALFLFETQCGGIQCGSSSMRSAVAAWGFLASGSLAAAAGFLDNRRLALVLVGALVITAAEFVFLAFLILLWALVAPLGYV